MCDIFIVPNNCKLENIYTSHFSLIINKPTVEDNIFHNGLGNSWYIFNK